MGGGQGKTPSTGRGEMNPAPSPRQFDYSSARMGRNGQGLQSRGYDYAGGALESHQSGFIDANEIWDPNTKWKCGSSGIKLNEPKDEMIGGRVAEPHAFPWMVRITGGCTKRNCGGALITSKHILTAYHCTFAEGESEPCDHSDGERMAIIGQNERKANKGNARGITVPIIGAKFPENAGFDSDTDSVDDHGFAMYILKDQVVFRKDILPICLSPAGMDYAGSRAVAAGWGRFTTNDDQSPWTKEQSPLLKRVDLMVSKAKFEHTKMLGTVLEEPSENGRGEWQDPCSGDGGGPLMLPARGTERWVIIGTVYGGGYNCKTGKTSKFEGEEVGIWNKVSAHTEWILDQLEEKDDDDDDDKTTTSIAQHHHAWQWNFILSQTTCHRRGPARRRRACQAHSEAGADYSGGPQYGQIYQGAGFAG